MREFVTIKDLAAGTNINYHTARNRYKSSIFEYLRDGSVMSGVDASALPHEVKQSCNVLKGICINELNVLPDLQDENKELKKECNRLKHELNELQTECKRLYENGKDFATALQTVNAELQTVTNENATVKNQLQAIEPKDTTVLTSRLTFALLLLGSGSVAFGITAPLLVSANMPHVWAYCLAVFVDLSAMVFILNKSERFGIVAGVCASLQLLVLLTSQLMSENFTIFAKAILISLPLFLSLYGFSKRLNKQ